MKEKTRQSIGIDCAKDFHVASFATMNEDRSINQISTLKFKNTKAGFEKLSKWIKKQKVSTECAFVMETTGVYHELLACYLDDKKYLISVVLPNKAKHFSKTLKIKTVDDKVSSQALAIMGLEKKLDRWEKPLPLYNQLRQLTRERNQIIEERSQIKCQLHAEKSGAWPNRSSIKRMQQRLAFLDKQVKDVEKEIKQVVKTDTKLEKKLKFICTIKGVGFITAITVIAETNAFNLIRNKKQLVSYAGLDVMKHTSGTSINKKPRISKHGNIHLRKCLHFPALTAIKHSKKPKELFIRLVSKHGIKMKAAVAVQRKTLILIYTLWKKEEEFDENYEVKMSRKGLGQSLENAPMELA